MIDARDALTFSLRCLPTGQIRTNDVLRFLQLMRRAFRVRRWYDRNGPIELTGRKIEARLMEEARKSGSLGASLGAWERETDSILVMTDTGSSFHDSFTVYFDREVSLPDLACCKEAIAQIRPTEACIRDPRNETALRSYEKRRSLPAGSDATAILRWFHFIGPGIVRWLGGVEHCLRTPVFKAQPLLEGVLFQITEERFDNDNPRHREAQMAAMRHLGLDKIEPVPYEQVSIPRGALLSSADEVTEELWQLGADPRWMIERARRAYLITNRKLRLFNAACLHRLTSDPRVGRAVELLEDFADGPLNEASLRKSITALCPDRGAPGISATLSDAVNDALSVIPGIPDSTFESAMVTLTNTNLAVSRQMGIDSFEGRVAQRRTFSAEIREIFPNPFRRDAIDQNWRTSEVVALARMMYEQRSFDRMGELAAALQAAGCRDEHILSHCHTTDPHYRGCWLIDSLLGKE